MFAVYFDGFAMCYRYHMRARNNFAFIDSQNLNLGIQKLGWKLDYNRFHIYLKEKYSVRKAYLFIGFTPLQQKLYDNLQNAGFILCFKPTIPDEDGKIKGNVDADLVLRAVLERDEYEKAVIVSSDGDFYSLAQYLYSERKLAAVISPDVEHCSTLLRRAAREKIQYMNQLRNKLEYKKKSTA